MTADTAAAHRAVEAVWRHARARAADGTDWEQIAMLYAALAALTPSPVVELNRAVAVAMALGPAHGLKIVEGLAGEPALAGYHHLPSVRGDLLARLGRYAEAAGEFRQAASLTRNIPEQTVLLRRAAECESHASLLGAFLSARSPVRALPGTSLA